MDKSIRKAVKCYLLKDNKIVVIKYKKVIEKRDIRRVTKKQKILSNI